MKKTAKILLGSGFALLLSAGAVVNFLQSSRAEAKVSDLTLANIEALALDEDLIIEKPGQDGKCPFGFRRFTIINLPGGGSASGGGYDCFCVWREGVGSGRCK